MGQLITGKIADKRTVATQVEVVKGLEQLTNKGYLKAHYSVTELKQMLSSFGDLQQYLATNDK